MRVYFRPSESNSNKYIKNIVQGLEKKGVTIANKGFSSNSLARIKCTMSQDVKVFHFNWVLKRATGKEIDSYIQTYKLITWLKILQKIDRKIIWTMHNKVPHKFDNTSLVYKFREFMIRNSDRIIIHCTESKEILKQYLSVEDFEHKVRYIPHGHYIDNYQKTDDDFRKEFNIAKDDFVFQFLGQIQPYKNIDLLIKVFNDLKLKKSKLLICGRPANDNLKQKLKKLTNKNNNIIFIPKFIPNNQIVKCLNTGDVSVLPYNKQSVLNSGSIYLALSYKQPVITSQIGTVKDMEGRDFIFSYNYETRDEHYNNLKHKMKDCYNLAKDNKDNFSKLGIEAYDYLQQNNSWDNIIKNLYNIYEKCFER
ncbi:glycosyltransferase [Halobacteroides halobius DSM 5150]|uniref:Glycosyltransferase n=1 Tax=Halobacteroides halobius (strain ATCC 35273 / DSM 5150 / MD-1) TaxID=748449 RepID=L0KAD4_HALHC|nr:glycosyltransferase [Halobacteroides halobius]AGB42267.1 glycosyltransferase [Halobacteroides halobius DSM 5150]